MPIRTDQAIVLRLSDYSETSQIVSLFTAGGGLARLIAKGVRRGTRTRVAVGLDLLEYGEVSYAPPRGEAGLGTLTEWVQRDPFTNLRSSSLCLYGGLYAAELVSVLTEEYDPHPSLFRALLTTLRSLARAQDPVGTIVRFQLDLAAAIGYAPNLDGCVGCGRPRSRGGPIYFSSTAGGLLCRDCEMHHVEKRRVSAAIVAHRLGSGPAEEWFELLDYHLSHLAGRGFKTTDRLRALLPGRQQQRPSDPDQPHG
jgi:DNA repair protein RecO (recombination protein O)